MASSLFIRLSSIYFWYFGILGLVVPFLSVLLDARGFTSLEIGEILAVITATKIIAPSLWAQIADKKGNQLTLVRFGALLTLISFVFIIWAMNYWLLMLCLAMVNLFWTAIMPQLEVMTLREIRRNSKIYGRIRLWGSIGFILFAMLSGEIIERSSAEAFCYIGLVVLLGLLISTLLTKQPKAFKQKVAEPVSILSKVITKNFMLFFFAGLLLQLSFGPYYVFFVLYLQNLEYSGFIIGAYIALGVVAEIGIFIFISSFFKYFSLAKLISISILITGFRWFLTGHYADNALILFFSQLLHAVSFGLYHSASLAFIQKHFNSNQQSRGQAIYIGGVYGVGGMLGSYIAGMLWLNGAGATASFNFAAVTAIAGGGLALGISNKKEVKSLKFSAVSKKSKI